MHGRAASLIQCGHTGTHKGSQLVAWCAEGGAAPVLDQVTDAAALAWEAQDGCWQLLSPVFGVLLLRQAGTAAHAAAALPVTPLLEAAVERQRSGALCCAVLHTCK